MNKGHACLFSAVLAECTGIIDNPLDTRIPLARRPTREKEICERKPKILLM
jgi:hypothetical protein